MDLGNYVLPQVTQPPQHMFGTCWLETVACDCLFIVSHRNHTLPHSSPPIAHSRHRLMTRTTRATTAAARNNPIPPSTPRKRAISTTEAGTQRKKAKPSIVVEPKEGGSKGKGGRRGQGGVRNRAPKGARNRYVAVSTHPVADPPYPSRQQENFGRQGCRGRQCRRRWSP
jgi:hypothetical protein